MKEKLDRCPTCGRPLEEHEKEEVALRWKAIVEVYKEGRQRKTWQII
jgi:uncharacterized protein with PIN domain